MSKQFIRDLHDKQTLQSFFLAKEKSIATGRNGKPYVSLLLCDSSGSVDARIWDNVESASQVFENGDLVSVKGLVQIFQNRKQIVVHKIEKADPSSVDMADLLSTSEQDPEQMMAELQSLVAKVENTNIQQLILNCLNDPEIRPLMLRAPAAKSIHHAYVGGLLEHILSICGLMTAIAAHYRRQKIEINLDYLIFGAIFHDLGKIWELEIDMGITYSDKGKLLGHMLLSCELIDKKASRILGFPEDLKDLLKHIVLSHHGKLEYGSPKTPMFLEAFIVAAIDDFDSKVSCLDQFIRAEKGTGEKWSRFNSLFERYFYLKA